RSTHETDSTRPVEDDRGGRAARGRPCAMERNRLRIRRAGEPEDAYRHHRADGLLVDRDGARARPVQEARYRVDDLEGSVLGGDPGPPHARRKPGDAPAARYSVRGDH